MKVIQVGAFFHPSVGGVERQMEEIAVHLLNEDLEVEVFTTDATHGRERRMQRLSETHREVPVQRFTYQIALGNFFRFSFGLAWQLWRADYDILHVHNVHDGHALPAILIRILRRKRIVFTGHNPYVVDKQKRGALLHAFVAVYDLVFWLFSASIDAYIALLPSEKLSVVKKFRLSPTKVHVVPNGIQELYYQQDGNPQAFFTEWKIDPSKWDLIVGTASRINFVKGLQNLKRAADKLPRVLFVFVGGDDGYLSHLKRLYRDNHNVIFTEQYLPPAEVKNFYQAIDVFLLPSLYEPFGMTVVEALAQGKPVLASNQGGPAEILPASCGDLLHPTDHTAWQRQIAAYVQQKAELPHKAAAARQEALKYQWPKVIAQIMEVYRGV